MSPYHEVMHDERSGYQSSKCIFRRVENNPYLPSNEPVIIILILHGNDVCIELHCYSGYTEKKTIKMFSKQNTKNITKAKGKLRASHSF